MVETQSRENLGTKESIFDYYSIEHEVAFVEKISHIPDEEQEYYIRENIGGFLGEYVGQIPYKKISYILKEDGLDYAGIKVMESYANSAVLAGSGSREWYETAGMRAVEDALMSDAVNVATIFSPPKIDQENSYSFAFHFEKGAYDQSLGGTPITEYVLRYPERMGAIDQSSALAATIHPFEEVETYYHSTEDFLATPLVGYEVPGSARKRMQSALSIDTDEILSSGEFEKAIADDQSIQAWMGQYASGVQLLARGEIDNLEKKLLMQELKRTMNAIYKKSEDIHKRITDPNHLPSFRSQPVLAGDSYTREAEYEHYAALEAFIVGGGSCPVTGRRRQFGMPDIYDGLSSGSTIQDILEANETWEYHTGNCRLCKSTNVDVGPCKICKECEKDFE